MYEFTFQKSTLYIFLPPGYYRLGTGGEALLDRVNFPFSLSPLCPTVSRATQLEFVHY